MSRFVRDFIVELDKTRENFGLDIEATLYRVNVCRMNDDNVSSWIRVEIIPSGKPSICIV